MGYAEGNADKVREVQDAVLEHAPQGCGHISRRINPGLPCEGCEFERRLRDAIAGYKATGVEHGVPYFDEWREEWVEIAC